MAVEVLPVQCFHWQAVPALPRKCRGLHQFAQNDKFPLQKHTVRLKRITHAKLAPDYLRTMTEDVGTLSTTTVQIPRPPNLPHEGHSHGKNAPKLGRNSVAKSFFWLLF
jgi:hypothetical protein